MVALVLKLMELAVLLLKWPVLPLGLRRDAEAPEDVAAPPAQVAVDTPSTAAPEAPQETAEVPRSS